MTAPARTLVVVNYHSAALTASAIRSARSASIAPLEAVVVDNSCDEREANVLAAAGADRIVIADRNLGYAGGINLGRRHAQGAILIAANPDVTFAAQSIDLLAAELERGAAVAGPLLTWDDAGQWLLPPADLHTTRDRWDEVLASRSPTRARARDRRRFRARVAFWSLDRTVDVVALSGAVLAMRVDAFDDVHGFDEGFPLYFEETDFLRRVTGAGHRISYVPRARCRHAYNQSAGQVAGEAAARYAYSERRYFEKWSGRWQTRALAAFARAPRLAISQPVELDGPIALDRLDVVVEASPLADFATAAGCIPTSARIDLPAEVLQAFRGEVIYLRVVERASGEVLGTFRRTLHRADAV